MTELKALICRGQDVLAADPTSGELLVKFDLYTELFEKWHAGVDDLAQALSLPEGVELLDVHAAVLERAQEVQGEVAKALKGLRCRGKGILAYTDTLPKRIGTIRPLKG